MIGRDDKNFLAAIAAILFGCAAVVGALAWYIDGQRESFQRACQAAGGVPSYYSVIVGKVAQSERACFTRDALIRVN